MDTKRPAKNLVITATKTLVRLTLLLAVSNWSQPNARTVSNLVKIVSNRMEKQKSVKNSDLKAVNVQRQSSVTRINQILVKHVRTWALLVSNRAVSSRTAKVWAGIQRKGAK